MAYSRCRKTRNGLTQLARGARELLRLGQAYEAVSPFRDHRPPLAG